MLNSLNPLKVVTVVESSLKHALLIMQKVKIDETKAQRISTKDKMDQEEVLHFCLPLFPN